MTQDAYTTRPLAPDTWDDFARLVEDNNGVWGGCWCIGFHPEAFARQDAPGGNRAAKREHVDAGTCHQELVYDGDVCVGWCQYGPPTEVASIKNAKAYERELDRLPDWRIGCIFTGKGHRTQGVASTAVRAAVDAISAAGGGVVEAYPEQSQGRPPQRGAYFHTGPEELYERLGFTRVRRIAKWRWVMRLDVRP
ncbi:GNAT family N-acetyltransferase [Solicola sp. PLA-1-18]|uniref:GNAT family N-acetyltransferase n=1 Tax=Solicola sp. PLA-1-18 TaxID=3380532 RepID=UPI003B81CAA9